jgi:2-polyprenyl-6-methoxyphenol hydroxylase-like FAD-dependent oxidoreductase
MQEALLAEAERAGAEVWRGVTVQNVEPGPSPSVVVARNGKDERISTRLVVAADGRGSATRKWTGFTSKRNVQPFQFAGVLLTGVSGRQDIGTFIFNPEHGLIGALIPQWGDRFRAYLGYPNAAGPLLQGAEKLTTFLNESQKVGPIFADCYAQARAEGPLETFDGGDSWVEHPYREGVALIGDAAATSDPSFGQGMALTLRDARVLRDALLGNSDWDKAGHLYAQQHDGYFHRIHTVCCWFRNIFQEQTPEAAVWRQRALPRLAEDISRAPDHMFGGPELPLDEPVRARFFGEY